MKAVVAAFNQEKALVGAFSVITNLRMELFEALVLMVTVPAGGGCQVRGGEGPGRGAAAEDLHPAVHCLPAPHRHRHHHQALASRHARDTLQKRF